MWVGKDPELFPNCSLLDWEDKADREKMGSSMCSRRQKKIFQTLFFLTIVFGFLYGLLLYYEMHNQLKKAENLSLKYQQHQEALSAQLQVVYEHRSRLEKSLQKERNEHKKAKEDYLVYKLEAQESLNKEKQDSNSRFSALSVQHKMLKSQHEDLRKQYTDLHREHVRLGEDHGRAMNEHSRQYLSLQQSKEQEIAKLKENIYNLFEENKKLRRAHQDVHVQLQDVRQLHKNLLVQHDQLQVTLEDHKNSLSVAQAQVEEYKQLRETLNKMPSLRQSEQKPPPFNEHDPHQGGADPRPYQERQGERGQVPYRADNKEREGEPSHVKPTVEEDDVPETRGGGGEEVGRQHPQHENWHRNPQPAEAEGEQTEEEGREHREWEREDKDHAVDQRDVHGQPDEGEDAESHPPDGQDVGNVEDEHTEEHDQPTNSPSEKKYKSPYEEQLEQQRLAELREEEARRLKERQDALHQQRLREYMDRQQRMQQEEKRKEELARQEQFRRRADYHHDDTTAETEDEHGVREEEEEEEEEADEDHNHHEEAEDQDPEIVNEQHQTEHEALKQQIDGNPDQQEDNLDEQYQDEEEADEKERGANEQEEEPVVEDPNQGEEKEDENYEEEPEEEDGEEDGEALAVKTNQRAEM